MSPQTETEDNCASHIRHQPASELSHEADMLDNPSRHCDAGQQSMRELGAEDQARPRRGIGAHPQIAIQHPRCIPFG